MTKNIFLSLALLLFTAYSFADGQPAKKINNSTTSIKAFSPSDDNFLLPDGYFNINYNLGFSLGDMKNYIKENSYRGFSVDGRKFINDKVTLGGYMGWTGFFEKFDRKSYQLNDATTVTGVGANTYYNFTIGMNAHYYPLENGVIKPYIGVNFGPVYQTLETQIGKYALEDDNWQFMVAPELGVFIPFGPDSEVGINTGIRYNLVTYQNTIYGFSNGVTYLQWFMGMTLEL